MRPADLCLGVARAAVALDRDHRWRWPKIASRSRRCPFQSGAIRA